MHRLTPFRQFTLDSITNTNIVNEAIVRLTNENE